MSGTTSIDDLLKTGGGQDESMVDDILKELNSKNAANAQQVQIAQQQQQAQAMAQAQAQAQAQAAAQAQQEMNNHIQLQQKQLEELIAANQHKDKYIQEMNEAKQKIDVDSKNQLYQEFKPTIILFCIIIILNQPALNKLICNSIGIEENVIFAILKCFIICIIFFLINRFL
tara:strand:- start:280 stop:795 length:516 start_codon:yes stop_codon:yes gene_type:complete